MIDEGAVVHKTLPRDEPDNLPVIVDELLMLAAESAEYQTDSAIKAVMQEAQRILSAIRRRLRVASGRYVIAAVGLTNVGKSTLLDALLGNELAPRRNRPCTAAPIEFIYGPDLLVRAYFQQALSRPTWRCATVAEARDRLEALADDAGANASHSIDRIVVELPHPLLKDGLTIADTPGFGAAQAADAAGSHERALRDYLMKNVSQVFWVVLADTGIGKAETKFRDQFFADICDDVLVTGSEDWDRIDRARFRSKYTHFFGQRLPRFHFVSGLEGLRAREASDALKLEQAGITALETRIRELGSSIGRTEAIRTSLMTLAEDLRAWLNDHTSQRSDSSHSCWRPDSWDRFVIAAAGHSLAGQLVQRLEFQHEPND